MRLELVFFSADETLRIGYEALGKNYRYNTRIFDSLDDLEKYGKRVDPEQALLVGMQVDPTILNLYVERERYQDLHQFFLEIEKKANSSRTYALFFPRYFEEDFQRISSERKIDFPIFSNLLRELSKQANILSYRSRETGRVIA